MCALAVAVGSGIALAACGGGGGGAGLPVAHGAAPAPATTPTAGPQGFAPVSFTITLPKVASAKSRTTLFVSPYTTSISVSVNSTTPQVFACTPPTCSGSFEAPAGGSVNFLFTALDAQGKADADASVTQVIAANGSNVISVTLNGVVASATLSASPAGLSSAATGTSTISATAYDVDGDVITGTYAAPIVVSTTDTTGTIALSGATLTGGTSTATLTYTYSAATAYSENHIGLGQTSATETGPQAQAPFEVGRTFYTFFPNAVVGFAPGATTPTRTIAMPGFSEVSSLACDGTNLYIVDTVEGVAYGIAPGATSPVTYSSNLQNPDWVAANDVPTGTQAQFYVANANGGTTAIAGFQGPASPPFTLPPNVTTQFAPEGSFGALQVDGSGNVYAALGGYDDDYGGYEIFNPALSTELASGTNGNAEPSSQIAVDWHSAPTIRIYTQENNDSTGFPEISEYDNEAATPSYVSANNDGFGLFVDSNGRVYSNVGLTLIDSKARRGAQAARRRALQYAGTAIFDVYPEGGLAGSMIYSFPGESLAFDSEDYVYDLTAAGSITIYQSGGTTVAGTIPVPPAYAAAGDTFGDPANLPFAFGTFCQ